MKEHNKLDQNNDKQQELKKSEEHNKLNEINEKHQETKKCEEQNKLDENNDKHQESKKSEEHNKLSLPGIHPILFIGDAKTRALKAAKINKG